MPEQNSIKDLYLEIIKHYKHNILAKLLKFLLKMLMIFIKNKIKRYILEMVQIHDDILLKIAECICSDTTYPFPYRSGIFILFS